MEISTLKVSVTPYKLGVQTFIHIWDRMDINNKTNKVITWSKRL